MSTDIVVPSGQGVTQSFGAQSLERAHETASAAVAAQARAAIESRYIVAMQRPRNWDEVRTALLRDCRRPSFAAVSMYKKPIGKGVEGLSIRFVEAALRAMGNILVESPTLYEDDQKRIVRVSVTDLESNVYYAQDVTVSKTVERRQLKDGQRALSRRVNSSGYEVFLVEATDDDVLNKHGALVSKAVRTLGLRLVPGDLQDEAEALIRKVRQSEDAADPDAARKSIVDAFDRLGVKASELVAYLGHPIDQSTPAELDELRTVWTTVKDGEATWVESLAFARARRGELDEEAEKRVTSGKGAKAVKERLAATKVKDG